MSVIFKGSSEMNYRVTSWILVGFGSIASRLPLADLMAAMYEEPPAALEGTWFGVYTSGFCNLPEPFFYARVSAQTGRRS